MSEDITTSVLDWQKTADPAKTQEIVTHLEPTIHNTLRSFGAEADPYLKSKARVLAVDALKRYDPASGARVETWVSRSLQPLRRDKRMTQTPLKVPDRIVLDGYALYKAEQDFIDKKGREPDLEELSDFAKMPISRIEKIRKASRGPVAEGSMEVQIGADNHSDYTKEAIAAIYDDSGYVDRKILEHKIGYGGAPVLPAGEIAKKLNLSDGAVSKRAAALGVRISRIERALNRG